ncbi:DUF6123 family protein [Bacillus tuaregi]|uniref:DUF6123 family protein n=1 Tax=Bacillus tuaregi TaxID=1816695 RepID=UPI0008F8298F|nr:DUF6123 family protein [Bacillus tuaregi]
MKTVAQYVDFLESKGFNLREDAIGFIHFGKQYTKASDELTNTAIELTLKSQKEFDGSYYISLLEMLVKNKISTRGAAIRFIRERELMAI